ncbi:MAG: 50S ribosomal protein L30 [Chloroflexaceae bacterium]|nr:50S ribosomal protein L30 [Chloroflexaceae bacterium]
MKQLRITYVRSMIGHPRDQKRTMHSLGLRKMHRSVVKPDNQAVRGMIFKVKHLVAVEEFEGEAEGVGEVPV